MIKSAWSNQIIQKLIEKDDEVLSSYNNFENCIMQVKKDQQINQFELDYRDVQGTDMKKKFSCQCGKQYNTFPALYLHFQRSHKMKISTKLMENTCKIERSGKIISYIYFFSQQARFRQNNQSMITSCFREFIESMTNEQQKYPSLFLLSNFHKYLLREQKFRAIQFQFRKISEMPNYFNSFILCTFDQMKSQDLYEYNCNILLKFSRWLNFRAYSTIKLDLQLKQESLESSD